MIFWEKTLWEGESPYNGKIKVTESKGIRRLVAQGYTQSRSLDDVGKTNHYWDRFRENLPRISKDSKVLILGLGGGTIAKILTNKYDSLKIKGVEIDPTIVELGKKYFYLDESMDITVEDAGTYIGKDPSEYGVICVYLFFRDKSSNLLDSSKFLNEVRKHLKKDGLVIINKICKNRREDREFVERMKKIFAVLKVRRERGDIYEQNVIFYGNP